MKSEAPRAIQWGVVVVAAGPEMRMTEPKCKTDRVRGQLVGRGWLDAAGYYHRYSGQ